MSKKPAAKVPVAKLKPTKPTKPKTTVQGNQRHVTRPLMPDSTKLVVGKYYQITTSRAFYAKVKVTSVSNEAYWVEWTKAIRSKGKLSTKLCKEQVLVRDIIYVRSYKK